MKKILFLLIAHLVALTATAQKTYDYRTEREVYHSKDLALYCRPNIYREVFDGVFLYPKKEYDHYREISKDWPKFGGNGATILNDRIALFQGALDYAFTPEQRAAFDSTQRISIDVCWDKDVNIYMLRLSFDPAPSLLSIAPEHYAKLYRYLIENIKIDPRRKPSQEYGWGFLTMKLTPEAIRTDADYYRRMKAKWGY